MVTKNVTQKEQKQQEARMNHMPICQEAFDNEDNYNYHHQITQHHNL